jgi:hypothetical protein
VLGTAPVGIEIEDCWFLCWEVYGVVGCFSEEYVVIVVGIEGIQCS